MKAKIFTLAFAEEGQGFDTTEFDAFMAKNKIITVADHFFQQNGQTYWAILLSYEDAALYVKAEAETYTLSASQQKLWDMLKTWRLGKAKQDQHPAFFILHDKQLLEIVRTVPTSNAALMKIRGIGEKKAQTYGAEILGVIEQWQKENPLPEK